MNFLAHLHLSDLAGLPLSGAVLGDVVRGRLEGRFPDALERSLRLHRRIDVMTDAHAEVVALRSAFAPGARRYAGVLLDLICDHALALDWPRAEEPLPAFAARAARAVDDATAWALAGEAAAPAAARFERLLLSYREEAGITQAIARVAARLREPQRLLEAAAGWTDHLPAVQAALPRLMADLEALARAEGAAR